MTNKKKKVGLSAPFLTYDVIFKAVFTGEENILGKLICSILGLDYNKYKNNITLEYNELPISSQNEKAKRCDFIINLGEDIICNLELNRSYYKNLRNRNLNYLFKLSVLNENKEEKYNINQLNINAFKTDSDDVIDIYMLSNIKTGKIYDDSIKIYVFNLVKCHEKYYNLLETKEDIPDYIRWGEFIYNDERDKSAEITEGILTSDERKILMDKLEKVKNDKVIMTAAEAIEEEERIKQEFYNDGIEQGIEQGIEKGIEEALNTTIKNMLNNNADYDFISKVTGKNIEEIKEIEKSMRD